MTIVVNDVPADLTYMTYADKYIVFVFVFHVLMSFRATYRSTLHGVIDDLEGTDETWRLDAVMADLDLLLLCASLA